MRLSDFQKKIIWAIIFIAFIVFTFKIKLFGEQNAIDNLIWFLRGISIFALIMWSMNLTEDLQEIVCLRYRIVVKKHKVYVKYLTFWWLIIPCWKPIDVRFESIKYQNLFGAEFDHTYTGELTFDSEEKAVLAIESHKLKLKKNRKIFLEIPKKESKKIKYL